MGVKKGAVNMDSLVQIGSLAILAVIVYFGVLGIRIMIKKRSNKQK